MQRCDWRRASTALGASCMGFLRCCPQLSQFDQDTQQCPVQPTFGTWSRSLGIANVLFRITLSQLRFTVLNNRRVTKPTRGNSYRGALRRTLVHRLHGLDVSTALYGESVQGHNPPLEAGGGRWGHTGARVATVCLSFSLTQYFSLAPRCRKELNTGTLQVTNTVET